MTFECTAVPRHHCGVEMLSPECESVTFYRAISAKVPQSWGVRLPFKQTESLTNKMWGSSSSGKRIQHHITATVLFIINYCHYHYIYIITISSSWSGKPRAAGSPQQSCPASAAAPRPADSPAAVECGVGILWVLVLVLVLFCRIWKWIILDIYVDI